MTIIKAKEIIAMFRGKKESIESVLQMLKENLPKQKAGVKETEAQIIECEKALGLKEEWSVS